MISVLQARELIDQRTGPLLPETLPLGRVQGRVLREPVAASEDIPPFDRSAMDGYAVRADDPADEFEVVAEIRAGQAIDMQIQPGQAVRIFTGARLPGPGLKVVMQEHVETRDRRIHLLKRTSATNVRLRGEDARAGEVLLSPGTRLDAAATALLASVGKVSLQVSKQPKILHLTTGDEIVPPGQTPAAGQIRNSNATLISGLCREHGIDEVTHFHSGDDLPALFQILSDAKAKTYDMILISGGSGQGTYDFSAELFRRLGATIHFREVNVRPGKPLIFGTTPAQIVFGLPGNALSHFVCFHLFVRWALDRLLARSASAPTRAFLVEPLPDALNARETWWPALAGLKEGRLECRALPWKSSGDITRLPSANALIRVPASTSHLDTGTIVELLFTRNLSS
ncbi:MAG: molybdopterin molybdotransferase MoeA [Methylacidiphilales bacterium]|nr:molybdopterin molybdotransferase MoeA [Candidatus Methylacidiphilales bacterium]